MTSSGNHAAPDPPQGRIRPWARRLFWRKAYDFLARRYRSTEVTFMNYGYRPPPGEEPFPLEAEDEPERSGIELYRLVTEGVDLAGKQVLEVGSGRGGGSSFIARYYAPGRIVGIDWSPDVVALSRARHMVTALDFAVGDAERLAFAAQSFDAVINVESSHCYGDLPAFLQSVRRVLRADGHFLYADFRPRTELDAWRALISGAGFRIARQREITAGVVAALDADHEHKRQLIEMHVGPLLQRAFHHFAGLRGTGIYELFSSGAFAYCAFVCVPGRSADAH